MAILRIIAILAIAIPFSAQAQEWTWPGNAQAAVSITYDDGWNSQFKAIDDLNERGFRGTFYLWLGNPETWQTTAAWRRAFLNGHEIGNHSVRHMCHGLSGVDLTAYTDEKIRRDLSWASRWLNTYVGYDADRTFAYPCGHYTIGFDDADSYEREVVGFHFAARAVDGEVNDPLTVDPYHIGGREFSDIPNASDMIFYVEEAAMQKGWAVLVLHGIDDGTLPISRSVHREFLQYLSDSNVWVAPVKTVARYILDNR